MKQKNGSARSACRSRCVRIALLICAIYYSEFARAETPPDEGVESTQRREAQTIFESAQDLYKNKAYSTAAPLFLEAYRRDPHPDFLLNAAQSFRLAGETEHAIRYFHEFLEIVPTSALRPQIEILLKTLEESALPSEAPTTDPDNNTPLPRRALPISKQEITHTDPTAEATTSARLAPPRIELSETSVSHSSPSIFKRWWFWTAIAVATTAAVVGVVSVGSSPSYPEAGLGRVTW